MSSPSLRHVPTFDDEPVDDVDRTMISAYDRYFRTGYYASRYPAANRRSLRLLMENGGVTARRILDFGCGNGRYVLALLDLTRADVVGYDVSTAALDVLAGHLAAHPGRSRAELVHGAPAVLKSHGPFDLAISMFGVISHIHGRAARLAALAAMRELLTPGTGRLVISVPSVARRRVRENIVCSVRRLTGRADGLSEPGDVLYTRQFAGGETRFFYHLYTGRRLRADLQKAGFRDIRLLPESALPEALVTRSAAARAVDAALVPLLPPDLGYGIVAVATPA